MKKLVLAGLLFPLISMSQTKNVLSTQRIFPKVDKVAEFDKALANHAQKYHTGAWKWRVYEIQSGPDFGGYMVIEGPTSWEAFGDRGDLGAEHTNDWNKSIAPLIVQDGQSQYVEFRDDLSSVPLTEYSKWITINHLLYNPGFYGDMLTLIGKMKPVWVAGNESVAVYTSNASGVPQFTLVSRYKTGLKEKDMNFRPDTFRERFEKVNGAAAFTEWVSMVQKAVGKQWSELLMFREDVSSK
jgi:hypothetical protein